MHVADAVPARERLRLGVYSDLSYRSSGSRLFTHQAFVRFVASLPPRVEEVVLFGRLDPEPGESHYELPTEHVRFVPLPHYPRVTALAGQVRAVRGTVAAFARELDRLDAVWIFGPHPMALVLALAARRRGKPLVLGVRQDYPEYIRGRLPSRRWAWAVAVAHALEAAFRLLGRRAPVVAVGDELADRYRGGRAPVLPAVFSLIRAADVVALEDALAKPWDGELQLVTVGRVDQEKNPLLLPEILARLRGAEPRWRLTIAGDGPLLARLEARAHELGLADSVELLGYVASGPDLWGVYRRSHAFLHVSLTEGVPQVLPEAHASGLPVVATDVGGVPGAVAHGASGLLVPPGDADAAAAAVARLAREPALRERLIRAGLERAAETTLERQLDRIASFLRANVRISG